MARPFTALLLIMIMLGCPYLCMASEVCHCCSTIPAPKRTELSSVADCADARGSESSCHSKGCCSDGKRVAKPSVKEECPKENAPAHPKSNCACQGAILLDSLKVEDGLAPTFPLALHAIAPVPALVIVGETHLQGPCHFPPWNSSGKIGASTCIWLL